MLCLPVRARNVVCVATALCICATKPLFSVVAVTFSQIDEINIKVKSAKSGFLPVCTEREVNGFR